ncbi:hypothetical protein EV363DRAFT_1308389 [Boletus edulis]|nr:hypothetical protein EV363DRAFT_1308389 [Boletus edulis]
MPPTMTSSTAREQLFDAACRFCDDFAHKQTIDTLLTHFSSIHPCEVLEHGLARFAPFLGNPFSGHDGVRHYFTTSTSSTDEARKVSVKGTATFTWITTCEGWDETFAYVLDFDDQNKIHRYQIWGDTGALYLASQGHLREHG